MPVADDFLSLLKNRKRGRLKVYIGSAAGAGKTYRMLQEAHSLRDRNVDVVIGLIETHGRAETAALVGDIEIVPLRRVEYRGVTLEELDLEGVIARQPEVVIVDELAHTNVPGSENTKRYEDVLALLQAGINVITAVNVQHLESLHDIVARNIGVDVRERVPDAFIANADQVVNIDVEADDLRQRLAEGKIYRKDRIDAALQNFFTRDNLTLLRELALREVASSVDRLRTDSDTLRRRASDARIGQKILVAMSSLTPHNATLLRKASRIAGRLNTEWYCVYVQTPGEAADRIDSAVQRRLVENIQLAQSFGAEVVKLEASEVAPSIMGFVAQQDIGMIIVGRTRRPWWYRVFHPSIVAQLLASARYVDVLIVSFDGGESGDA